MIVINNLCLSFTKEYDALHGINLEVKNGEKVAFVGDAESGKTMLIRCIAGLEDYKQGEVYLKDINVNKIDFKTDIAVAYVPKRFVFKESKTVLENLEWVLKLRNIDKATINVKVLNVLKEFEIESLKDRKIKDLTDYQKTLVQLARISLRVCNLYLIDDITSNLGVDEKLVVMKHFKKLVDENTDATFVFAFSDKKLAEDLGLKVIKLKYGSLEKEEK